MCSTPEIFFRIKNTWQQIMRVIRMMRHSNLL